MLRRPVAYLLLTLLTACATPPSYLAPKLAPARTGTPVSASFSKTWDAVIDIFASKNISIKTLDRTSGLIVAEAQTIASNDTYGFTIADCGALTGGSQEYAPLNGPIPPTSANWNVLVRSTDSTNTLVRATVRFVSVRQTRRSPTFGEVMAGRKEAVDSTEARDCVSKGVWEADLEKSVKATAESKK
jgi:hypothetical protein